MSCLSYFFEIFNKLLVLKNVKFQFFIIDIKHNTFVAIYNRG